MSQNESGRERPVGRFAWAEIGYAIIDQKPPNRHPTTGIAYGVVAAMNVPNLWEEIVLCGTPTEPDDDETDYTYEHDGFRYEMTHLGGAAIIFVKESPFIALTRPCSPCCANAGDLDEIGRGNLKAYCFDPVDYVDHEENPLLPLVVDETQTPKMVRLAPSEEQGDASPDPR